MNDLEFIVVALIHEAAMEAHLFELSKPLAWELDDALAARRHWYMRHEWLGNKADTHGT